MLDMPVRKKLFGAAALMVAALIASTSASATSAQDRFLEQQSTNRQTAPAQRQGEQHRPQQSSREAPAPDPDPAPAPAPAPAASDGGPRMMDSEINPDLYQGSQLFPGYRGFISEEEDDGGPLTRDEMEARIDAMARRALIQRGDMGLTLNDLRLGVMFQLIAESPDPATIRMLREMIRETERAKFEEVAPEPMSQLVVVERGLHSQPINLATTYGYVSEITFIDAAGNPWPYRDKILGNSRDFSIIESGDAEVAQNKLLFSTINRYRGTNFKVILDGFDVAVTFNVVYDDTLYHDNLVVQVDGLHTRSQSSSVSGRTLPLSGEGAEILQNLAINIPPPQDYATRIQTNVSSGVAQVFRTTGGDLLLRTRNSLLLPSAPQGVWHGPGGFAAYRIGYWPMIQLADEDGRRIDVVIDR